MRRAWLFVACSFVAALVCIGDLQASTLFPRPTIYSSGNEPVPAAVADFNGDGFPDLLMLPAPANLGHLNVVLGDGHGGFAAVVSSPNLGYLTAKLAVGDVNGDGILDIVTLIYGQQSTSIGVNLGMGDGSFQEAEQQTIGGGLGTWITLSDVNGDGYADIVSETFETTHFALDVALNAGDGTFLPVMQSRITPQFTQAVAADFNRDGVPDIVGIDSGSLWFGAGKGDGTFQSLVQVASNMQFQSLVSADFNGDAIEDLATEGSNHTLIWTGNGDGTFQAPVAYDGLYANLAVADFNADGLPDLFLDFYGWEQGILVNKGGNSGFNHLIGYRSGMQPLLGIGGALAADLNGDGYAEMIVSAPVTQSVGVFVNRGPRLFNAAQAYAPGVSPGPLVAADFNNDGRPDIALGNGNGISVVVSRPNGFYSAASTTSAFGDVFSMVSGDFNGDHKPDLVYTANGNISMMLAKGNGVFALQTTVYHGASWVGNVMAADFNGDGKPDLAGTIGSAVIILLGQGDGTFQSAVTYPAPDGADWIRAADLNNDGVADLALASGPAVSELLGRGDGTFAPAVTIDSTAFVQLSVLAVADINGDGNNDLLLTGFGKPRRLIVYFGNGDGSFQPKKKIPLQTDDSPVSLVVDDFNQDGFLDLVLGLGNQYPGYISPRLFLGNGDGTFQKPQRLPYVSGVNYGGVAVADFNLDGWPDLVFCDLLLGGAVIVENQGGK